MNLAYEIEKRRARQGYYPSDWPIIATRVKALAGWCCERCGVRNNEEEPDGTMLTVHHLDGHKFNCELWNLAALCQRCHLRIQNRIRDFYSIPYVFNENMEIEILWTHSAWMARHVKGYNVWAMLNGKPQIPLEKIVERSYEKEWN